MMTYAVWKRVDMYELLQVIRLSDLFPFSLFFQVENAEQAYRRTLFAHIMIAIPAMFFPAILGYGAITEAPMWPWYLSIAALIACVGLLSYSSFVELKRSRKFTKHAVRALVQSSILLVLVRGLAIAMLIYEPNAKFVRGPVRVSISEPITLASLLINAAWLALFFCLLWRFVKRCERFT